MHRRNATRSSVSSQTAVQWRRDVRRRRCSRPIESSRKGSRPSQAYESRSCRSRTRAFELLALGYPIASTPDTTVDGTKVWKFALAIVDEARVGGTGLDQ